MEGRTTLTVGGETLTLDDMGDGFVMLSQISEDGRVHRVGYDAQELVDALLEMMARQAVGEKTQIAA